MEKFDSLPSTVAHIQNVRGKLLKVIADLVDRGFKHDMSKLEAPEKDVYDEYTPLLRSLKYGTPEYYAIIRKMQPALDHHYSVSRHHPEYFADGFNGMNLIDMIELLCDWKAAGERHIDNPMDIFQSIDHNAERFKIEPPIVQILKNTASYLWYE